MTDYEHFVPLGDTRAVKDPRYPSEQDGFLIVIPLYAAVPLGIDDNSVTVDGKFFCSLGKTYQHYMTDVNNLVDRTIPAVRRSDYDCLSIDPARINDPSTSLNDPARLQNDPWARPLDFWTEKGQHSGVPANILADPSLYQDFASWDKEQEKRWTRILGIVEEARPNIPFNVYSRFVQPAADQISLVFTPADSTPLFDVATLQTVFGQAFANNDLALPNYTYTVIDWAQASQLNLVLVGAHYLGFYYTWMTSSDFEKIWKDIKQTPVLERPWPTEAASNAIDLMLHNNQPGARGSETTVANMSHFKVIAATGQRGNYPGQKTVMGGSATEVAEKIWDASTSSRGNPADAEWLHRNAFHFGGLPDIVDLGTSQARENLVFGTGESNTHMIRAENAITSLLAADANITQDNKRYGTLTTVNQFSGQFYRLAASGAQNSVTIPDFVGREKYMWLSLCLKYQWTMNSALADRAFNVASYFDPFSRYIPLRVEARLDDALMEYLREERVTTQATSSVNRLKRSVALMSFAAASPDTSFLTSEGVESTIAWQAARAKLPYIDVGGVRIRNPVILTEATAPDVSARRARSVAPASRKSTSFAPTLNSITDVSQKIVALRAAAAAATLSSVTEPSLPPISAPESVPPSDGFVLAGDISLFGNESVVARLEVWEGPPPAGVVVTPDKPAVVQRATLVEDFHFSALLPDLKGTAFDDITFRNVSILRQNYPFEETQGVGWHFTADWVIDESCGSLHDVLSSVLNVDTPVLSIRTSLGEDSDWGEPLKLHSFTLEGIFAGIQLKPIDGLVLTSIGVRLFGIRTLVFDPKPRTALEYGFAVFGSMNIDVPSSVVPLQLDYEIQEHGGTVFLAADVGEWRDPLGAKGLTLSSTSFSTSFSLSNPWSSFTFDVSAFFMYKDTHASFTGSFSPGNVFELSASVYDFNLKNIADIFDWISSGEIPTPDIDISIETATIVLGNERGLQITLSKVAIDEYTALDADLEITSHSVRIKGDLTSSVIEFGDVEVKQAFLQVLFETAETVKSTDIIVGGEVTFSSLTFDAAVHLYKAKDGASKGLEWTVLATLTVNDEYLALSKIVPEVEGTYLDLALRQVVFVAASKDDPSLGNMIVSGYDFHQGVQVCATLDQLDPLESLMRAPVPGLVVSAGWSKVKGFEIDVLLPSPTVLNLGNNIKSTPFKLGIQTKPVNLILSAGLSLPIADSPEPLVFTFSLNTNLLEASATGQMTGWWVNPLGLSPNVKIGPNVALSISIIFAQFVSTGTPSGFAISGGLAVGQTEAQVALSINEDPMKELLYAEVDNLNLIDVVSLAEQITNLQIPEPPKDFLDFEEVKIYVCPAGVTIGTVTYPQGFSFAASMIVFGKQADISCAIESAQVTIKGGVDNFNLGPLTVRGTTGPRATVECEVGPTKQSLLIDGMVELFDAQAVAHIDVEILPSPKFSWYSLLSFTDLLTFQLKADLVGAVKFTDLSDTDFVFDALLEQKILQYIRTELTAQFDRARHAAEEGIEAAQDKLTEAEKEYNAAIDKAQADLDAAYADWQAKTNSIHASADPVIKEYNDKITSLQADITRAKGEYDDAMESAERAVDAANRDRAQKLADAQHSVDDAKRAMVQGINDAQAALDQAQADMDRAFGSAHDAIESARRAVQSLQNQINDVYGTIHDYENASWWEFWKKAAIPELYAAVGVLEASKYSADLVLQGAEAVLSSADYVAKEVALAGAKEALEAAKSVGQAALDGANDFLKGVDAATQFALDSANAVLEATKTGVEWTAFQGAVEALQLYKEANEAAFNAAVDAIEGLAQCAEWFAYQTAKGLLAAAKSATVGIDAAKKALDIVKDSVKEALNLTQWIVEHGTEVVDIQIVHLSGSLRGIIGVEGKVSKPLAAHVEGIIVGQAFTLDAEFDPRGTAEFIANIFEKLWDDMKSIL